MSAKHESHLFLGHLLLLLTVSSLLPTTLFAEKNSPKLTDDPKTGGDDGAITLTLAKPSNAPGTNTLGELVDDYGIIGGSSCRQTALNLCPAYIIVNLVDWGISGQAPQSRWILIHSQNHGLDSLTAPITGDATTRIYGSKLVGLLAIHLNVTSLARSNILYSITEKQKQSVQMSDFSALINLVVGGVKANRNDAASYLVGARLLDNINSVPCDIAVTGKIAPARTTGQPEQQGQNPAASFTKTYDDEGFSRWDAAVAVPLTGVKETDYVSDGKVHSKTSSKAYAYGMFHFYPFRVDLKGDYPWKPSLVGGLPLSGKTLNKPFAGAAFGIKKPFPFRVNPFVGVVFNKVFTPRTLTVGEKASATQLDADLRSRREYKLLVGIDIPVTQFVSMKGSKSSSSSSTGQKTGAKKASTAGGGAAGDTGGGGANPPTGGANPQ